MTFSGPRSKKALAIGEGFFFRSFLQRRHAPAESTFVRWISSHKPLVFAATVFFLAGCRGRRPIETSRPSETAAQEELSIRLLRQGHDWAARGQSVRAEQYFLAAVQAGAAWDEVFPPLLGNCVQSGRLRAGLHYVSLAKRRQPEDEHLYRLAATLHLALGQIETAEIEVDQLSSFEGLEEGSLLFLADFFFDVTDEREKAAKYYLSYLDVAPRSTEAKRVQARLNLLKVPEGSRTETAAAWRARDERGGRTP